MFLILRSEDKSATTHFFCLADSPLVKIMAEYAARAVRIERNVWHKNSSSMKLHAHCLFLFLSLTPKLSICSVPDLMPCWHCRSKMETIPLNPHNPQSLQGMWGFFSFRMRYSYTHITLKICGWIHSFIIRSYCLGYKY